MAPRKKQPTYKRTSPVSREQDILGIVPRSGVWPGEDVQQLEALRQAFVEDLAPGNAYEHSLVEQILALDWEIHRARRLRDSVLLSAVHSEARRLLSVPGLDWEDEDAPDLIATDLVGDDRDARKTAAEDLLSAGHSVSEVITEAYRERAEEIEFFDEKVRELERRKHLLREDFDRLKKTRLDRSGLIVDAEIIE